MDRHPHQKEGASKQSSSAVLGQRWSQRSPSDDPSSSRPPLERSDDHVSQGCQSYLLSNKTDGPSKSRDSVTSQEDQGTCSSMSRESSTESTVNADMQFVVLDDEDDEDDGDGFMQSESIDNSGESSTGAGVGSTKNNTGLLLKCSMCDRVFSSQQRLMLHVNKHMGAKPYACPQCPANFNSRASFQRHRRSHKNSVADIQTHTCNLCQAQFSNIQHLTEHLKIHTEKRRSCPHCGIFIGGSRSLQKHISIEHPSMIKTYKKHKPPSIPGRPGLLLGHSKTGPTSPGEGGTPVSCRLCGRQFQTNRALQGHMKGHSKLYQWNPRRCRCGILLADEAEYQRHLRNSCCTPSGNLDLLSPPMDSPGSLSPVSPTSHSQFMSLAAQRQMNIRSGSLDSYLRNHTVPLTLMNNYPVHAEMSVGEVHQFQLAHSRSVEARIGTAHPFQHPQDDSSSVSKETQNSTNASEQIAQSPVGQVKIKTECEEWSEVVDIVGVHSNATASEEPSSDHTAGDSEAGSRQSSCFAYSREQEASVHGAMEENQAVNSGLGDRPNERSGERDVVRRHIKQSIPEELEATSSHRIVAADASSEIIRRSLPPRVPTPHQEEPRWDSESRSPNERTISESPNTQITSSQSAHPASNSLVNPSLLGERDQEGLPWRCSHCGITFEDSLMYVIHKGCHEPGSQFRCSMCGKQCTDKVTFMLHFVRGQHTKPTHV